MTIRRRFAWHFLRHFLLVVAAVVLTVVGATVVYVRSTGPASPTVGIAAQSILAAAPAATRLHGATVVVAPSTLARVRRQQGFLQVLDAAGRVVFAYRTPRALPSRYTPGQLVYARLEPARFGYAVYTWYQTVSGRSLTWVFGVPYSDTTRVASGRLWFLGALGAGGILVVLAAAWLFGRRLGTPLLHTLEWVEGLAFGRYAEPLDRKGRPRSRPTGALRGAYRMYGEVIGAMDTAAAALVRSEEERRRTDAAREEWIAGVSHDLRTPLSSVKGYATLLAAPGYTWSGAEVRRFGERIGMQADQMEALVADMNLAFRLRSGSLVITPVEADLAEITRRAVIDLVNGPRAAGRTVDLEAPRAPVSYPADPAWLGRAVRNLVDNAVVHNPPGTRVTVSVRPLGPDPRRDGAEIVVADDGVGMNAQTVRHLFDRYFQGEAGARGAGGGSGLGSAIAQDLVTAHGGEISVRSAPGRGTVLTIRLPGAAPGPHQSAVR